MKYTGRIIFLLFSILVSIIESFNEETNVLSLIEALFFGMVAYFVGGLFDKSTFYRKQAEISKERYRNLIEYSPDPIIVYQENKIVYANDKLVHLLQLNSEEIIGKSIFDFILPNYHTLVKEKIRKLSLGNKDVLRSDIKIRGYQDRILDIEATSVSIVYNNKPSIEVFIRDVTLRNTLEEESRKNGDLYRFITENTTDIISYINPNGNYEYMSPSCEQLLGYDQNEIIHNNLFQFIHPDELDTIAQVFAEAKSHIDFASFPHRYRKKDGGFIWLETNARTIRNNKKELEGVVTVSRDITERVEKEKSMIETNEMLQYLSNYDGLTDIPNRRFFVQTLDKEWNRAMRHAMPLSVLMVDIDNFKKFNDFYGHQHGDWCIKEIASTLIKSLKRPGDFVARYGGEEFVVILPDTDSKGAATVGEILLSNVRKLKLETEVSEVSNYVTISIGCATVVPSEQMETEDLLKLADKGLYSAKEAGKNLVKVNS